MRNLLLFIGLCLLAFACNDGNSTHHRSFVISKSHQETPESESFTELQSD